MHFISSGDISRLCFAILKVLTLTNLQVCCWLLFCTNSARNCSNPRKHRTRSTLFLHLQLFVTSCSAEPLYCAPLKTLRHRALDPSMSHSHLYIGWMRVFQRFLEHFFSILVHLVCHNMASLCPITTTKNGICYQHVMIVNIKSHHICHRD